jgi:hypothetical protein
MQGTATARSHSPHTQATVQLLPLLRFLCGTAQMAVLLLLLLLLLLFLLQCRIRSQP